MSVGKGSDRTAGKRVLAGLAVLGVVLISGLLAAWGVSPGAKRAISAADEVALRFPSDWNEGDTKGAAPPPATFTLASVSETAPASVSEARPYDSAILFNPNPTWPLPASASAPQASAVAEAKLEPKLEPKFEPRSEPETPRSAPTPEPQPAIKAEIKPAPKAEAKPVVVARTVTHVVHHAAAPHSQHQSGVLFNEAQLASIKARLKLSDYQEQYWPAVAAALHAIGERAAREPVHVRQASAYAGEGPLSGIDPDGPEVQQLKSAAFPLIISMNDEQKNQVRALAHVMGLEQVASSF